MIGSPLGCAPAPLDAVRLEPTTLGTALVAHWTFDEGAGDMAYDHSGNGRTATVVGATWDGDGRFGGCVHLAKGNYLVVDQFPDATQSWTVSAWVRAAAADLTEQYTTVLSTEVLYQGGWELNLTPSPGFHFGYWIGPSLYTYTDLGCDCMTPDEWNHVAIVLNTAAGKLAFYRDGNLQREITPKREISAGEPSLYIGKWNAEETRQLVGALDDIAIYSRALAPEEVAALTERPPPDPR